MDWIKIASLVVSLAWVPLIVRQVIRYRRRRHPGKLALISVFLLMAFVVASVTRIDAVDQFDMKWASRIILLGNAIACVHFYVAIWLGRPDERTIPTHDNSGDLP